MSRRRRTRSRARPLVAAGTVLLALGTGAPRPASAAVPAAVPAVEGPAGGRPILALDLGTPGVAVALDEQRRVVGQSSPVAEDGPATPFEWRGGVVRDLGPEGRVVARNGQDQVVGMTADGGGAPRAVLWSDGGEIPLGPPDARESVVVDVDERGRALIGYVAADGSRRVALWKDGAGTEIAAQPPDQIATAGEHRPVAVDEGGAVVVNVVDAVGAPLRSYLWRDGVATDLGSLGGGGTAAVALNGQGQVAGTSRTAAGDRHAFLWTGGTLTDLGTLGGPTSAPADGPGALNDAGEVVGSSETATGETHAFVWRDGALVDLGTLGGAFAEAVAINAEGTVTGTSTTAGGDRHPFLWYEGTIGDLGTLGGAHGEALAMNEAGDVAGTAQGADGVFRAVLWTCRPPV